MVTYKIAVGKKEGRNQQDQERQPARKMIHLRNQRRGQLLHAGQQPADPPDFVAEVKNKAHDAVKNSFPLPAARLARFRMAFSTSLGSARTDHRSAASDVRWSWLSAKFVIWRNIAADLDLLRGANRQVCRI